GRAGRPRRTNRCGSRRRRPRPRPASPPRPRPGGTPGPAGARPLRLLPRLAVDGLTKEVRVAVVACVFLDHVDQDPAKARRLAARPGALRELIQATLPECVGDEGPRPFDGA